jgi:hypothetical protein
MSGNRLSAAERRERSALRTGAEQAERPGMATRFRPGQSGNPGGRPKGIAAAVKDRVKPEDLVDILVEVAQDPRAKASERIAAVKELTDRGWGKAPAFAAIEGSDPLELGAIAAEAQAIADELTARRIAREAPPGEGAPSNVASG